MGVLTIRGGSTVFLAALKLGLEFVENKNGVETWRREFKRSRRNKKLPRGYYNEDAVIGPWRPYDHGGDNDEGKAIEYARWLAARNGVTIPDEPPREITVDFVNVKLHAYSRPIKRASCVHFGEDIHIHLPHVHYDPTAPVVEEIVEDEPQLLAAA